MKLSEFKHHLQQAKAINFVQPNGNFVPRHFHITEAGLTTKHFVDCGGTIRSEKVVNLQIWTSVDFHHRLQPEKLLKIISICEMHFGTEDLEVEVEFQTDTLGKYGLGMEGENFKLVSKAANCLAGDKCGIPESLVAVKETVSSCCAPGSGCC